MKTPIPHDDHTFMHLDCQLCLMQEVGRLVDANKALLDEVGELRAERDQLTVQYRVLTLDRDGQLKRIETLRAENELVTDQEKRTAKRCADVQAENTELRKQLEMAMRIAENRTP